PASAHAPPLAPTVSPHDCLSRYVPSPPGYSMASAPVPQKILTGPTMLGRRRRGKGRCWDGMGPCACPAGVAFPVEGWGDFGGGQAMNWTR
ncbi:MAG TPA: hypothetical protein VFU49_20480, partial [Ktedonobacteraceae bacterium]|nr:hypothetical protein [Ktedonobacteraceae bacterium]